MNPQLDETSHEPACRLAAGGVSQIDMSASLKFPNFTSNWLLFVFGTFVMVFTFGIVNMLIGLVVERTAVICLQMEDARREGTTAYAVVTIVGGF